MSALHVFTKAQLGAFFQSRVGEIRLGQTISLCQPTLSLHENLQNHLNAGGRYVLLGIPEDLGPRANCGLGGADQGWSAFLGKFLNLQSNELLDASKVLLLGEVDCAELQQQSTRLANNTTDSLTQLRQLCAQLDQRVQATVKPIFDVGLIPIVIGGGHNNALPLLQALSQSKGQKVNCINLDPHADFRALEGRHSGNGFSYAKAQGVLNQYLILGLHQQKNNAASLAALKQAGAEYLSYQQIFVEQTLSWQQALDWALAKLLTANTPLALELDTDCITAMPASALNYSGLTVAEVEHAVYQLAKIPNTAYLHLAEAAPAQHPAGLAAGINHCGQVLSQLVQAFLYAKGCY